MTRLLFYKKIKFEFKSTLAKIANIRKNTPIFMKYRIFIFGTPKILQKKRNSSATGSKSGSTTFHSHPITFSNTYHFFVSTLPPLGPVDNSTNITTHKTYTLVARPLRLPVLCASFHVPAL